MTTKTSFSGMKIRVYNISRVLFALLLFCHHIAFSQNAVPDEDEKAALLALFQSTNGGNWTANKWVEDSIHNFPNVALPGVEIVDNDIIGIRLSSSNLTGQLPQALNKLTALKVLLLQSNNLNGTLPNLDSLGNLNNLNLGNNYFNDNFPLWMGTLINLKTLHLSSKINSPTNKISGPIPANISQLTSLETLDLSNNNFSQANAIPDSFSNLKELKTLTLQNCQLTGSSINTGLNDLLLLEYLNLNSNPSLMSNSDFPDILKGLPNLKTLVLRSNSFQRLHLNPNELPLLNYLDLSFNNYSDPAKLSGVVDTLSQFSTLKTLLLMNCQIVSLPNDFSTLSSVEVLYLNNNLNLNPAQCNVLGAMTSLQDLYILNCNLSDLPPNLINSSSLRLLNASNNLLNPLPSMLQNIPQLEQLYLNNNGITELGSWFGTGNMISLKRLYLNNNLLETLSSNFSLLTNLQYLSINSNNLNGTWPANFTALNKMVYLDLSSNKIHQLPNLASWVALKEVYLQNNLLSGTVPDYLTNLTSNKSEVNISQNAFDNISSNAFFSNTKVSIGTNRFTFKHIQQLEPSSTTYNYDPQATIDEEREVRGFAGGNLTLIAHVDTIVSLNTKFQWFKYIDGSNDIALNTLPQFQDYKYTFPITIADEGAQYYYQITSDAFPQLTLQSNLISLILNCDILPDPVGFHALKQLCAVKFIPNINYPDGCRTTYYLWEFGDGNSSLEKSPLHVYASAGTYDVSMNIRFKCGSCVGDTVVTKSITYNPSLDFLKDSVIQITTDIKPGILATSASTFSDAWPLEYKIDMDAANPYETGALGVWRNDAAFVYNVPRDSSASPSLNLAKDGTYKLKHFNWEMAHMDAIPDWIRVNEMTQYSPYSFELENKDVLGNHSSALYGYFDQLPTANGLNMRNNEMAFTSFEDLDQKASGNWMLGNSPVPRYTTHKVRFANDHIAIVEASVAQLQNVHKVDVFGKAIIPPSLFAFNFSRLVRGCEIVCVQEHPEDPNWSIIVLRKPPFDFMWRGQIIIRNAVVPLANPDIDHNFAHSGKSSLKITSNRTFKQELLSLDSGKSYLMSAWVSVNDQHLAVPKLADNIGIDVIFKNENGVVGASYAFEPTGNIIEGWQQLKGVFTSPGKEYALEIRFKPGSKGSAWYDDLRLHPEEGNMQSYVYDINNYRLKAILDEENFASFYYYDEEGNLHLVKKETEQGVKTISESVSYKIQREN